VRQKCVVDGKQVNIPVPRAIAMGGRRRLDRPGDDVRKATRFKRVGSHPRKIRVAILRRDDEASFGRSG
jgi:hypothetical protein